MIRSINWLVRKTCDGGTNTVNGFLTGAMITLLVCTFVGPLAGFAIAFCVNWRIWWEERRP